MKVMFRVDGLRYGKWEPVLHGQVDDYDVAERRAQAWLEGSELYMGYAS